MLASDLNYELPPELIAQTPAHPRDAARLLRVQRSNSGISHHKVLDLPGLLLPGDLLVFNDTRVLRARLRGHRATGGAVEALLLQERGPNLWECLLKPSSRLRVGELLTFANGAAKAEAHLLARTQNRWLVQFQPSGQSDLRALLPALGEVPLPPYIRQMSGDDRYQTVYARKEGDNNGLDSAAAPTAGLHFSETLLQALHRRGVKFAFLTLAVGPGTFAPVKTLRLEDHVMHAEEFDVPLATAEAIRGQRQLGGRVVAVGTTVTRVLESVASAGRGVLPGRGSTSIFITPGHTFQVVDALLTNFHLPRSTLLALVGAFAEGRSRMVASSQEGNNVSLGAGLALIQRAYALAVANRYRFFSFGDAMFIE